MDQSRMVIISDVISLLLIGRGDTLTARYHLEGVSTTIISAISVYSHLCNSFGVGTTFFSMRYTNPGDILA